MAAWVQCRGGCDIHMRVSPPDSEDVWCEACAVKRREGLAEDMLGEVEDMLRRVSDDLEGLSRQGVIATVRQWWPGVFTEAFEHRMADYIVDIYSAGGTWGDEEGDEVSDQGLWELE